WAQLVVGLLVDALLTGVCAVVFAIVGIDWLTHGFTNGFLLPIFALMFGAAARHQFATWKNLGTSAFGAFPVVPVEPVHPASIRPEVLPRPDEPPPVEGYLAALAREKREPPRADME